MNGGNALRAYCLEHGAAPDVVLADYNLEEENGLELVRFVREHFAREIPAALITADRSDPLRERATAQDVSIINKPVRPAVLRALLSHFRQTYTVE
jgi:CheY-like chemotaxis protein